MKGLLIGGTSHCGKSTLAAAIGAALDLPVRSTDQMGRHPGRPWLGIPRPVAEFLSSLSDDTIYWFLRVHHANMWPLLTAEIERLLEAPGGFVLEGSALRPESMAALEQGRLACVCLHASHEFLVDRIRRASDYDGRDREMRRMIDNFVSRSLRDNDEIVSAALTHGVRLIDASDAAAMDEARSTIIAKMSA